MSSRSSANAAYSDGPLRCRSILRVIVVPSHKVAPCKTAPSPPCVTRWCADERVVMRPFIEFDIGEPPLGERRPCRSAFSSSRIRYDR